MFFKFCGIILIEKKKRRFSKWLFVKIPLAIAMAFVLMMRSIGTLASIGAVLRNRKITPISGMTAITIAVLTLIWDVIQTIANAVVL
jgi:hypothetical protein